MSILGLIEGLYDDRIETLVEADADPLMAGRKEFAQNRRFIINTLMRNWEDYVKTIGRNPITRTVIKRFLSQYNTPTAFIDAAIAKIPDDEGMKSLDHARDSVEAAKEKLNSELSADPDKDLRSTATALVKKIDRQLQAFRKSWFRDPSLLEGPRKEFVGDMAALFAIRFHIEKRIKSFVKASEDEPDAVDAKRSDIYRKDKKLSGEIDTYVKILEDDLYVEDIFPAINGYGRLLSEASRPGGRVTPFKTDAIRTIFGHVADAVLSDPSSFEKITAARDAALKSFQGSDKSGRDWSSGSTSFTASRLSSSSSRGLEADVWNKDPKDQERLLKKPVADAALKLIRANLADDPNLETKLKVYERMMTDAKYYATQTEKDRAGLADALFAHEETHLRKKAP